MSRESENKSTRWWDIPSAMLLLAAILTAATRLVATNWTIHLSMVQTLALFGVLAGLALGMSRFSPRIVILFTFLYGAFAVPWQIGITLREDILWLERLSVLANRLNIILFQIVNQKTVQDSLLFLFLMAVLFWSLAVSAGYSLVRYGRSWWAILPTGIVMFIIHAFDPLISQRAWYLAVYLFFSLILVARMVYLHHSNRWRNSRTALPPHLGLDFIRFTILAAFILIIFAWTIPALANALPAAQQAWRPVQRAWNDTRQRFENVFAALRPSAILVSHVYGDSAVLGRGNPLSDVQVFSVRAPANLPPGARLYWRARTYDTYDDGQWLNSVAQIHPFNPQRDDLPIPTSYGRWLGTFRFVSAIHMATLFTPPQPFWVNRTSLVEYAENTDNTLDISAFRISPSLEPGQTYEVQASISYATVAQLKNAGIIYPEWVTERYLQLPDSITPRTRQLAERITEGLETPYDKVEAITTYLRENITYVEIIPEEFPRNQEVIDWFLFDLQKGFCNYYSTAEIILLRLVGIPARWAVGFAQGERLQGDPAQENAPQVSVNYVVRQQESHAWPEVHFPGIGWVEFEPTASQPDIARIAGEVNPNSESNSTGGFESERMRRELEEEMALLREERRFDSDSNTNRNISSVVYWSLPVILSLLMVILYFGWRVGWIHIAFTGDVFSFGWSGKPRFMIRRQPIPVAVEKMIERLGLKPPKTLHLWAHRATLPSLTKSYLEINYALSRLGHVPLETDTPAERVEVLSTLIPPASRSARQLLTEYHLGIFSKQPANPILAKSAAKTIKSLSLRAFIRRLASQLQRNPDKTD